MKLNKRSILAVAISLLLAACGSDTKPTVPVPDRPEPLVPAPAEPFDAQIGNVTIKATKEELVITSNTENDKLASIESFKGIKYAEAQRFEHSNMLPLSDNTDEFEVIDATQFGYACPQLKT
ncbi:carboxylesterase/lipase family protein, partial [Vibrio sp. 10N.222.54.A1]